MTKALVIKNTQCLRCDALNKEMIMVGPFVLCNDCFELEFVETGEYTKEKKWEIDPKCEAYKGWLAAYKKYIVEWVKLEDDE